MRSLSPLARGVTCALAQRCNPGGGPTMTVDDPRDTMLASDAVARAHPRRQRSLSSVFGRAAGWTVVVVGVVLMPLPGPGTLIVVAGLRILVPYHRWAAASYDRVRDRAVAAARAGVATRPRVVVSIAGVVWVAVLTGMYVVDVSIPQATVLGVTVGPSLPFHSTATVVGLFVSSVASAGATLYSIVSLRPSDGRGQRVHRSTQPTSR